MQVHRFRDRVGLALEGKGETRYLTPKEARKAARALNAAARSIEREPFHKSPNLTVRFTSSDNAGD